MGLSAAVYKNSKNVIVETNDRKNLLVDTETGESYFEIGDLAKKYSEDTFIAFQARLGNTAEIGALNEKISSLLKVKSSLLGSKILYSASHCGDKIEAVDIGLLEAELRQLVEAEDGQGEGDLNDFVGKIDQLVHAAREQGQPIVFV